MEEWVTCFSQKNVYKWAKLFKEGQNNIQDDQAGLQG